MDAAPSTLAGIITASATVLTAFGGVLIALGVLIPILRQTRSTAAKVTEMKQQVVDIHHWADGELTAAREAELSQTRITLALLKRVIALDEARGLPRSQSDADELAVRTSRVADLEDVVSVRKAHHADEQAAALSRPPV